jgi:hypothetical protein
LRVVRPATIVNVYVDGTVNLQVLLDGHNDKQRVPYRFLTGQVTESVMDTTVNVVHVLEPSNSIDSVPVLEYVPPMFWAEGVTISTAEHAEKGQAFWPPHIPATVK